MSKSDWDIPARKIERVPSTPNFNTDLKYGRQGEKLVDSFLSSLSDTAFEVKTDRYRNGRMAVETQQNPRRMTDEHGKVVWRKSGLMVTKAQWWVYVYTLDDTCGAFMVVSVKRLKKYIAKNKKRLDYRDFAKNSDNPAQGYLLEPSDVMDMMINPDYDG
jgi:hypothetical protein